MIIFENRIVGVGKKGKEVARFLIEKANKI